MSYNILDVLKDFFTGKLRLADKATRLSRLASCHICEARDKSTNTCTACGCFIPAKARLEKSECPMDIWER
jgi:hypothetical protein